MWNSSCLFKKNRKPFPTGTSFSLPSPIPTWPPGEGFGSGTIDLGGLEVSQITIFDKIWATHQGGPDNMGATFYEPSSIPHGFFMIGSYSQSNNKPLFGWVLVAKDTMNNPSNASLRKPIDYKLIWSSEYLNIKQDGKGYIWEPIAPEGFKAIGYVITNSPEKPSVEKVRCVRFDLTEPIETDTWIWSSDGFNVYGSRPTRRGTNALGVATGTFIARNGGDVVTLACLKNIKTNISSTMPNLLQIDALVKEYSPWIYFHPDEKYLPSSVSWFFQNGALLYKKGEENNPTQIEKNGLNLPQGGSNDGSYWLDLPIDENSKENVKRGNLNNAYAYLHVKPMFGGTITDFVIWLFYPFNGPARAKVKFFNLSLGQIGEHVSDWEHITLRISNFNGELRSVFFSEHSGGTWVDAFDLEFKEGNKPVAYASLHGHACFHKPGLVLQGSDGIGIRNDTAKSNMLMDTGSNLSLLAVDYLPLATMSETPWLYYSRKWGPKIDYDINTEIKKVEKVLPGILKKTFEKIIKSLPNELLGEEGPTGPKIKDNWTADE